VKVLVRQFGILEECIFEAI